MDTPARLHRLALCATALLFVASEYLPGQEPGRLVRIPRPDENINRADLATRFRVSSVLVMAGQPIALLTDTSRSWLRFLRINDRVAGEFYAKEITREQVILAERGSDQELRLPVTEAAPADPTVAGPAPYTKAWINSPANPMRHSIVPLPDEICRNWAEVTVTEKMNVAAFYEQYGWKLVSAEIIRGLADFVWERSDIDEMIAAAKAQREAFAILLAPEQLLVWQQIRAYQSIYAVEGKFTDEQRQFIAERGRVITGFQATLSAEQKAAYDYIRAHPVPAAARSMEKSEFYQALLSMEKPTPLTGPAPYTKAWINSPANPMLNKFQDLPGELAQNWAVLTSAEKAQVVEFYQKHGWQPLQMETVSGSTGSSSWQNIYEAERIAVLKANREAFLALLSPAQRQTWQQRPSNQTIYTSGGSPNYARNRNGEAQQRFFDPFWASLNPAQKAAYEAMNDFTKAVWK